MNNESRSHDQERHGEGAKAQAGEAVAVPDSRAAKAKDVSGVAAEARVEDEAFSLTVGERRAYRMGVLAAGAMYIDATHEKCGCRPRVEHLRIMIAARGTSCEAPEFWPTRGGA